MTPQKPTDNEDTITVSTVRKFNGLGMKLAYIKDENTVFIDRSGRLNVMPSNEFTEKCSDKTKSKALNVEYLRFSSSKKDIPGQLSYTYKVKLDNEGNILRPEVAFGDQAMAIFMNDAPFSDVDGVKGKYPTFLSVRFLKRGSKIKTIDTKRDMKVARLLDEMDLKGLKEVCALLGIPSFGKTTEELFALLADRKSGVIYIEDNIKLFLDTYELKINKDSAIQILVQRAMEFNIIRVSQKEKQKEFWFSDTLLGYDKAGVILFLKRDETMQRALKLQVDIKLESEGVAPEEEKVSVEAKAYESENMATMRAALEKIRKSDNNPDGVWDIGKKAIHTVSKEDIKEAYKKYVLKAE